MLSRKLSRLLAALVLASASAIGITLAADPPVAPTQTQVRGSQLMTPQERAAHRNKVQTATSAEERARIRAEEHALMQQRAEQQGLTLPNNSPAPGAGGGMRGSGMGGGRNR